MDVGVDFVNSRPQTARKCAEISLADKLFIHALFQRLVCIIVVFGNWSTSTFGHHIDTSITYMNQKAAAVGYHACRKRRVYRTIIACKILNGIVKVVNPPWH